MQAAAPAIEETAALPASEDVKVEAPAARARRSSSLLSWKTEWNVSKASEVNTDAVELKGLVKETSKGFFSKLWGEKGAVAEKSARSPKDIAKALVNSPSSILLSPAGQAGLKFFAEAV